MILARTSARTPLTFPLNMPAGLLNIMETREDRPGNNSGATEGYQARDPGRADGLTSKVEIHIHQLAFSPSGVLDPMAQQY